MNNFGRLGWAFALLGVGGAAAAVTRLDIPLMRALPPPSTPHELMGAAMGAGAGAGGRAVLPMVRVVGEGGEPGGVYEERQRSGWKLEGDGEEVTGWETSE